MEGNYVASRSKTHMIKEDHSHNNRFGFEEHNTWGTCSWPARNYSCSFCKREFRSAQALGGHMNVHRRDRARLRSSLITSSSWGVSDHSPKPNPTNTIIKPNNTTHHHLSSSSSSSSSSPISYLSSDAHSNHNNNRSPLLYSSSLMTLSSYYSSLSPAASTGGDKKPRLAFSQVPPQSKEINNNTSGGLLGVEGLKGFPVVDEDEQHKLFNNNSCEHNNITLELGIGLLKHPSDKLDLELRLGH